MNIIKEVPSWNKQTNKDVFGNGNPSNIDHIWPKAMGGSNIKENLQILSEKSNDEKKNKSKGKVNGIRFSIVKSITSDDLVYGTMYIQNKECDKDKDEWIKVIPVR